jgi:glucose/arabinose dehydrogenase
MTFNRQPIHAAATLLLCYATLAVGAQASQLAGDGATDVYLAEQPIGFNRPASIMQFRADGTGRVSPSNTLQLPPDSAGLVFTVDLSGQIYAALSPYYQKFGDVERLTRPSEIAVYAPDASGSDAPLRTITSSSMNYPRGIAVAKFGEVYVADADASILVFSDTADGPSQPIRTIYGSLTTLTAARTPGSLALDGYGYLYVSVGDSVLVFPPDADGNVAPVRTITTTYKGCKVWFEQIGLDERGSLYALTGSQLWLPPCPCAAVPFIFVFAAGADGNSRPIKTILPNHSRENSSTYPFSMGVDRVGNVFTVSMGGSDISVYDPDIKNADSLVLRMTVSGLPERMVPVLALH